MCALASFIRMRSGSEHATSLAKLATKSPMVRSAAFLVLSLLDTEDLGKTAH